MQPVIETVMKCFQRFDAFMGLFKLFLIIFKIQENFKLGVILEGYIKFRILFSLKKNSSFSAIFIICTFAVSNGISTEIPWKL